MSPRYSALSTSYLAKLTADFHSVCQDVIERAMNVCFWPIASFRCAAEFSRYRGIADSGKPTARQIHPRNYRDSELRQ
jgi:hypothetical protein